MHVRPIIAAAVCRTLNRWNGDRGHAEDLIQDVFAKLCLANFNVLRQFRGSGDVALKSYLRVIAARLVMDAAQTSPQNLPIEKAAAVPDPSGREPFHLVERRQRIARIADCLTEEKDRDRRIFWLYYRFGLKPREIANLRQVALAQGGVEMVLFRLTRDVKKCVEASEKSRAAEGGRK